jgi:uncharacterized protein with von Willebrand factor type A (vWA) domain
MDDTQLLEHTSSTTLNAASSVSAQASLDAFLASEASLALDSSLVSQASTEDLLTEKGQLNAEEKALVERMIPIPNAYTPKDAPVPIEYFAPPTRDHLKRRLGVRGYPWPEKLQNALNTVNSATETRKEQIKQQKKWSDAATKLVTQLATKKNKVSSHVQQLSAEIKELLKKKKQIQNKQLQDKLVKRLETTHANLQKIRRQTHDIRKNQAKMIHHKEELAHALEDIKRSLALLKGFKRERMFPSRGVGQKMQEELSKFDPDLSSEHETNELFQLKFPDAVALEMESTEAEEGQAEAESEEFMDEQ